METMNLACAEEATRSIYRLPHEILATIFVYYARDYDYGHLGSPARQKPSWVNVSYVCRQWRGAALDCPTLWSYIFFTSRCWTEELLARSKQASLIVRVRLPDETRWFKLVGKVLDHMGRIQELRMQLSSWGYSELRSRLSLPTHRLQILEICVDSYSREWSFVHPDEDTPALRSLDLSKFPASWHSFQLSSLAVLGLRDVPVSLRLSMEDFLATLSSMQNLKYLYLDQALTSAAALLSSTAFHTLRKINLPRLSRLLIAAPLSTVIALLSCVDVPSKTMVKLECDSKDHSTYHDYGLLSSLLSEKFTISEDPPLPTPVIRSLAINFRWDGDGVAITFGSSEGDCFYIPDLEWDCDLRLRIAFHGMQMATCCWHRIASDLCCRMPLNDVESVHVNFPPFSRTFWRKTLGPLRRTRYLQLSRGNMPDVASELAFPPWDDAEAQDDSGVSAGEEGWGEELVPRLEELELFRITFLSARPLDSEMPAMPHQDLPEALATRSLPGRLMMWRCELDAEGDESDHIMGWRDGDVYDIPYEDYLQLVGEAD